MRLSYDCDFALLKYTAAITKANLIAATCPLAERLIWKSIVRTPQNKFKPMRKALVHFSAAEQTPFMIKNIHAQGNHNAQFQMQIRFLLNK